MPLDLPPNCDPSHPRTATLQFGDREVMAMLNGRVQRDELLWYQIDLPSEGSLFFVYLNDRKNLFEMCLQMSTATKSKLIGKEINDEAM